MKPEIKQRIEQIRNGQVPEGYKKTKAGIVPEEWEETRLDKYLTVNKEKNVELKYSKEDVFSISGELGIVNQIELLGRSYAGVSVAPYGVVYPNDIVYTKSPLKTSPYGIIKANKTGKFGIVSTLYAVFHCNKNASSEFIQFYFESDHNLNNYLYPIVNIGAKHDMKISDENSLKGWIVFPPFAEQEKIAEILSTQDKIIELYQRKIDELQKLKKIYLSTMFPQKGKNVPEWRFPQFTDAWEQRKLGELLQTLPFKPFLKEPEQDGKYEVIQQGNAPVIGFANGTPCCDFKDTVIFGDHTLSLYKPLSPFFVATDGVRIVKGKQRIDGFFLLALLGKYKPQSEGYKRYYSILADSDCYITKDSAEQQQIGAFFRNLDNIITLHQRKLEEMKKQKKALMQLLLTGIVRVAK